VSGIAFDAQTDLLESSVFQYLLGDFAILDILEEAIQVPVVDNVGVLFASLRRILVIPVDDVFVVQYDDMAFPFANTGTSGHYRKKLVVEIGLKLVRCSHVGDFV